MNMYTYNGKRIDLLVALTTHVLHFGTLDHSALWQTLLPSIQHYSSGTIPIRLFIAVPDSVVKDTLAGLGDEVAVHFPNVVSVHLVNTFSWNTTATDAKTVAMDARVRDWHTLMQYVFRMDTTAAATPVTTTGDDDISPSRTATVMLDDTTEFCKHGWDLLTFHSIHGSTTSDEVKGGGGDGGAFSNSIPPLRIVSMQSGANDDIYIDSESDSECESKSAIEGSKEDDTSKGMDGCCDRIIVSGASGLASKTLLGHSNNLVALDLSRHIRLFCGGGKDVDRCWWWWSSIPTLRDTYRLLGGLVPITTPPHMTNGGGDGGDDYYYDSENENEYCVGMAADTSRASSSLVRRNLSCWTVLHRATDRGEILEGISNAMLAWPKQNKQYLSRHLRHLISRGQLATAHYLASVMLQVRLSPFRGYRRIAMNILCSVWRIHPPDHRVSAMFSTTNSH